MTSFSTIAYRNNPWDVCGKILYSWTELTIAIIFNLPDVTVADFLTVSKSEFITSIGQMLQMVLSRDAPILEEGLTLQQVEILFLGALIYYLLC